MLSPYRSAGVASAALVLLLLGMGTSPAAAKVIVPSVAGWCLTNWANPLRSDIRGMSPLPDAKPESGRADGRSVWTHPVRCLTNGTAGAAHHCLYTNAFFGSGHGASIVTAPHVAADLIGADTFEDRPSHGGSGRRVWVPGPLSNADGPAYEVAATPGKGMGTVARRKIQQGEILMLDFPAVIVGKQFLEDIEPLPRRRLLKRAIAQLPEPTQRKVFALAKTVGGEAIDDIFGTNTCSITLGVGDTHLGLYPEVSRINHACNPNAYYRFSSRLLTMEIVAYRDIQPGEEITISYSQLTLSRDERRKFLMTNWRFDCQCTLCRAGVGEVTDSEDNRRDIRKYRSKLAESIGDTDYLGALMAADELKRATDAEGVTPLLHELHDMLAAIHLDMKDYSNARRYGRLAVHGWEEFDSVDDYQLTMARWFMGHIEQHKKAHDAEVA